MGYKTIITTEDGGAITATTVNDTDESYVYATATVAQNREGFERNAVVIVTDFRAEDQSDVDTAATGRMRDDAARALGAALTAYYEARDA